MDIISILLSLAVWVGVLASPLLIGAVVYLVKSKWKVRRLFEIAQEIYLTQLAIVVAQVNQIRENLDEPKSSGLN